MNGTVLLDYCHGEFTKIPISLNIKEHLLYWDNIPISN